MKNLPTFFDKYDWLNQVFDDYAPKLLAPWTRPAMNIKKNDTSYDVELVVPGFSKENITISVQDKMIIITGKQEENTSEKENNYSKREYQMKEFKREFALPENADLENIDAKQKEGILNVHIPLLKPVQNKNVKNISIK